MPPIPTQHIQVRRGENVRIGPISLITLIVAISLAVLSVLTLSTATATNAIAQRQANATQRFYLVERSGQEFVADVDDVLAQGWGIDAVDSELDAICERVREVGEGRVACVAGVEGDAVNATFICDDTIQLSITLTIRGNAYRISEWKTSSAGQVAQSAGTLWSG